jgi:hypothetical protein
MHIAYAGGRQKSRRYFKCHSHGNVVVWPTENTDSVHYVGAVLAATSVVIGLSLTTLLSVSPMDLSSPY